jgi:hypothetical protein
MKIKGSACEPSSLRIKTIRVYHGETRLFEQDGLDLQGAAIHTESFSVPLTPLSDGITIEIGIEFFASWGRRSLVQITSAGVELRLWGIVG